MSKQHRTNARKSTQGYYPSCSCGQSFRGDYKSMAEATKALCAHVKDSRAKS